MSGSESDTNEVDHDSFKRVRGPADVQRLRLERLMKNPEKDAHIPEPPKTKAPPAPAEFVRFYMGSSAGAGSGEFHIYRNLRRKEQNRMKYIEEQAKKDDFQKEFQDKYQEVKRTEEEKAAKKRLKRQKKKARSSNKKTKTVVQGSKKTSSESEDSDESENEGEKSAHIPQQSTQVTQSPSEPIASGGDAPNDATVGRNVASER